MDVSPRHPIADQIDLLVTAAVTYRVLVDSTTAVTFAAGARTDPMTPTSAGQLLLEQYRSTDQGPAAYQHRLVDVFEPVEVVKASHGLQHLCQSSPAWPGSRAAGLLATIERAAIERLPGYADAPWLWTRAERSLEPPITLDRAWIPHHPGLRRLASLEDLLEAWEDAALILVPIDVLDRLPLQLPDRAGVYVCAPHTMEADLDEWTALQRLGPDAVVMLPIGEPWLREQLRDPDGSHHRSRLYRRPVSAARYVS